MRPAQRLFEMITITGSRRVVQKSAAKIKYEIKLNGKAFLLSGQCNCVFYCIVTCSAPHLYTSSLFPDSADANQK